MKKKLSVITALALSVLSLTPMSSGAVFDHANSDSVTRGWTIGRTEIDPKYNCLFNRENSTFRKDSEVAVYINKNRTCATVLYEIKEPNSCFNVADGVTFSQINEALKQNFEPVAITPFPDRDIAGLEYPNTLGNKEYIDGKEYYLMKGVHGRDREICNFLKDEGLITDYVFTQAMYSKEDVWFDQILHFGLYTDAAKANAKKAADYLAENDIAVPVYYTTDYYGEISVVDSADDAKYMKLETPEDMSLEEQLDIALDIYNKFGLCQYGISPDLAYMAGGKTIDLYNAVVGDANNDGEVGIADATLILQSIANADKYILSPQGAYNADVNGSGDVTALDALEVQKIDADLR